MKIKLRFFASYREMAGTGQIEYELPRGKTISDFLQMVQHNFHDLPIASINVAVNAEFVGSGYELHEGDEVALLPPVSGG